MDFIQSHLLVAMKDSSAKIFNYAQPDPIKQIKSLNILAGPLCSWSRSYARPIAVCKKREMASALKTVFIQDLVPF